MHNAPSGDPATVLALPTVIKFFRSHGYTFVNLQGDTGKGYQVLASNGSVRSFGAPGYGSAAGALGAGVKAVALAADPDTGGYWILKSNGGVNAYHAPRLGSLVAVPRGQRVTAIAASYGGYLVLASNGSVHNFGAPWHGSAAGTGAGVTAVGLAADPATGGYWILKSNGGVAAYDAPWHGSLAGKLPRGESVTGIAAAPGGYLVLTSNGGVHNFGAAWYGSAAGSHGPRGNRHGAGRRARDRRLLDRRVQWRGGELSRALARVAGGQAVWRGQGDRDSRPVIRTAASRPRSAARPDRRCAARRSPGGRHWSGARALRTS